MSGNRLGGQVKLVSSLTRSGSSRGQSDSIVHAIQLRLEDAGHQVGGVRVVYKDLDGGSEARGSWDAEREMTNARYAAADADVVAYIAAIEQVGAKDRAAITRATLATRDFAGLLGRWGFDSNGDIDLRQATRLTVRDGDFSLLRGA